MRSLLVMVMVGGCDLYSGSEPTLDAGVAVDAAPVTCESAVAATCGPRPARAATEMWAHDIDLWAKCAESAAPVQH